MDPIAVFSVFIVLAIFVRLAAGAFDGERVEEYVRKNGWKLIDRSWDPFGPGWFGEKDSRIYQIVYEDREGCLHQAHVKTSMLSGVYLTNDRIVERPRKAGPDGHDALQVENERLRKRIRELEELR